MKILLLEDNLKLSQSIVSRLQIKEHDIDTFIDGGLAYEAVDIKYQCFILDINVPSVNGLKILEKIRNLDKQLPVIIMSSTVELDTIKEAYRLGCDDFLKKPFFIDELEIKLGKICKAQQKALEPRKKLFFYEKCYFDYENSIVCVNDVVHRLTKKERQILELFLSKQNQILTYEQIQNYVWEHPCSQESIRSLVRKIRKLLVYDFLQTSVDIGYLFTTKLETSSTTI